MVLNAVSTQVVGKASLPGHCGELHLIPATPDVVMVEMPHLHIPVGHVPSELCTEGSLAVVTAIQI